MLEEYPKPLRMMTICVDDYARVVRENDELKRQVEGLTKENTGLLANYYERDREVTKWLNKAVEFQDQLAAREAELESYAKLQARCYEGFPSASDGIFDALADRDARIAVLTGALKKILDVAYSWHGGLADVVVDIARQALSGKESK